MDVYPNVGPGAGGRALRCASRLNEGAGFRTIAAMNASGVEVSRPVVVVGAGLAGLCAAIDLHAAGRDVLVVEAGDRVGGRVATDEVDGFLLDRGFQVLQTAYPEAKRRLDYDSLRLRPFQAGALIRFGGKWHRLSDPWRQPLLAWQTVKSEAATLPDKLRVGKLRARCLRGSLDALYRREATTTLDRLRGLGFSDVIIERFFRPFLGGVFCDRSLETSSRMLEFTFRMFARGDTALPADGMKAISNQLGARLSSRHIRLNTRAVEVGPNHVIIEGGERIETAAVVVAVEGPAAVGLVPEVREDEVEMVASTAVYFAAPRSPMPEPTLMLNGEPDAVVNSVAVLSEVQPSYAPSGKSLVSVGVVGSPDLDDASLEMAVRDELIDWFGEAVTRWDHLRTYRIRHALPNQRHPRLDPVEQPPRLESGVFLAGDHRETGSIHGAMHSGTRAAAAVLASLSS